MRLSEESIKNVLQHIPTNHEQELYCEQKITCVRMTVIQRANRFIPIFMDVNACSQFAIVAIRSVNPSARYVKSLSRWTFVLLSYVVLVAGSSSIIQSRPVNRSIPYKACSEDNQISTAAQGLSTFCLFCLLAAWLTR